MPLREITERSWAKAKTGRRTAQKTKRLRRSERTCEMAVDLEGMVVFMGGTQ
jgi:hypothetical protein